MPRRLARWAPWAYAIGVVGLTTGPQLPGRLNIVGNIVLFVPFGALLAIRWPRLAPLVVVVLAFVASGVIEVSQYVVFTARDVSLNDIALNTSGSALGWIGGRTVADLLGWSRQRPAAGR